jgi:predicted ATP-binding protein involved in virulence
MATYFMDLALENVKCFKGKQVLDLSDGNGKPARWTIILGENGTGKTTILKALASFSLSYHTINDNSKINFKISPLILDLVNADLPFSRFHTLNVYIGTFSKGVRKVVSGEWKISKQDEPVNIRFPKVIELGFYIYAYGASRRMSDGSLTESNNPDQLATLFSDKATLINAEAWLLETDFAISNSKGETKKYLQKRYELIKETLKNLLPDLLDFRIKEITKTQTQAAIEVQTPYGWVAMKELSYGYLTFIGWVVDLAARMFERYPDSDTPLSEPAIVLVDEIDLHLHPKWQRQIIEFLTKTFTETQFIVTAHSPLIVQAAEGANLVLLKREGDSVKIYNDMEREVIKGWRVDQVLSSDLFGLESTRPPAYDKSVTRQKELLEKDVLTPQDEAELEALGKELEEMSLTNDVSPETMKFMQRALKILQTDDKN